MWVTSSDGALERRRRGHRLGDAQCPLLVLVVELTLLVPHREQEPGHEREHEDRGLDGEDLRRKTSMPYHTTHAPHPPGPV